MVRARGVVGMSLLGLLAHVAMWGGVGTSMHDVPTLPVQSATTTCRRLLFCKQFYRWAIPCLTEEKVVFEPGGMAGMS